jgi:hypothetical protein
MNIGWKSVLHDARTRFLRTTGTYRDFDRHDTPIGFLPGVAVPANAVETELQGNPVKARSRVLCFSSSLYPELLFLLSCQK